MKSIKQILENDLKDNEASHAEYLTLVEFARPYEGKRITRAIGNKLPAGYKLQDGFSSLEVVAPSGRKHSLARFEKMNNFTLKDFEDDNSPYSRGASDRIEKLKLILDNPKTLKRCEDLFDGLRVSYQELKKLAKKAYDGEFSAYPNPAFYDILREYKISHDVISDLNYDKGEDKFEKGGELGSGDVLLKDEGDFYYVHGQTEKGSDWMKKNGYKEGQAVSAEQMSHIRVASGIEVEEFEKGGKAGKTEKILYGTKKGEPNWKEQIITEDETQIEKAKTWAEANGFDRIRVATIDLSKAPDFAGTVNMKKVDEFLRSGKKESGNKKEKGGEAESDFGIGDLVFVKGVGSAGLVGLVTSDIKEEDGESGYDVYFRGLRGDTFFMPENDIEDISNGHLYLAQDKGDLMHYPNIAKKLGITINSKYEDAIAEDEMGKGGRVTHSGNIDWLITG